MKALRTCSPLTTPIARWMPGPLALQGFVALVVLIFALTPAQEGTAIYLPLGAASPARTIAWSRTHGAALVAPGPYSGAFFLRIPSRALTSEALREGALLISVPEFLCGTPAPKQMADKS